MVSLDNKGGWSVQTTKGGWSVAMNMWSMNVVVSNDGKIGWRDPIQLHGYSITHSV